MTLRQIRRAPRRLVSVAVGVTSQRQARRNALVASTALTQRRLELHDVEEFLAEHSLRVERLGRVAAEHPRTGRTA